MERATALKKLGKLLGKNLGYRVDPKAPTQDERDAARVELLATSAAYEELKKQCDERHKAICDADAELQRLRAERNAERERREKLASMLHHYKFTAGVTDDMFFMVKGQGDSWEQVIEKIEKDTP